MLVTGCWMLDAGCWILDTDKLLAGVAETKRGFFFIRHNFSEGGEFEF
jgi:hypothetical protein